MMSRSVSTPRAAGTAPRLDSSRMRAIFGSTHSLRRASCGASDVARRSRAARLTVSPSTRFEVLLELIALGWALMHLATVGTVFLVVIAAAVAIPVLWILGLILGFTGPQIRKELCGSLAGESIHGPSRG